MQVYTSVHILISYYITILSLALFICTHIGYKSCN